MKLHKRLTVNGKALPLVSDDSRLNLFGPGVAQYTVQATQALTGLVVFCCGYQRDTIKPWFVGFIERSSTKDAQQQTLFCRELGAVLNRRLPLCLNHCTLADTVAAISTATGLAFILPKQPQAYSQNPAPNFYNLGSGLMAVRSLAGVYNIPRFMCQQKISGKLFVGSWSHSHWATKKIALPQQWENKVLASGGFSLPAWPALRPGARYNNDIITGIDFTGARMAITVAANPWAV